MKCEYCGAKYRSQRGYARHLVKRHPREATNLLTAHLWSVRRKLSILDR